MKLGIIGCGLIGRKRADAACANGLDVIIAADTDAARVHALAAPHKAKATTDWREVISSNVDIVNIAVTHDLLGPMALAAVKAGKHVLVEKPAGRSVADVRPVAEAARNMGKFVKVGFNHRFHPAMQKAKAIAESGALGRMMFLRGRYGHGGRLGYEKEWRFKPEISGGGEMVDQGSHLIDLSRWFLGDLSLEYAATPTYFWNASVDDNCFIALRAAGGQLAWLHASWSEWKNIFSLEIYGRDGKLTIEGLGGSYGVESLTFHKMLPQMGPPETTRWEFPFPDNSWAVEFASFLDSIRNGTRPVGDIEDALAMFEIVDQAYCGGRP